MRSLEELRTLVDDIEDGKVFLEPYLPSGDLTPFVFLPLKLIDDPEILKPVYMIYEYLDKAINEINGYPMFATMKWLTKEETNLLVEIGKEKNNV